MINTKFILLLSTLSVLFSCSNATQPKLATITGQADFKNQWLYLVKPDPWLVKANIIDSSKIDEKGNFKFSANIPNLDEFLISGRGFFITNVFIENGSNLNMVVQGKGNDKNGKKVSFDGAGSGINNFWVNFSNRYYKQGGYNKKYKKLVSENEPLDFQISYGEYATEQVLVVDSFIKAAKPNKLFAQWLRSYVEMSCLSKNFTYLFHKPKFSKKTGYMEVDDSYYGFLKDVNIKKSPEVYHSAYNDFIYFYIVDHNKRNLSGHIDPLEGSFQFAMLDLPQGVGNIAAAHLLKDFIQMASTRADFDKLRSLLNEYKSLPESEKYHDYLVVHFNEKAVLAPGSPAPNFTLADLDGNKVSLSDFKGKVVVLDFWGTWCGPCKRELPFSKKIEEHYKDRDDIVFLFVALERGSKSFWKDFVHSNDLPGVHLYSANSNKSLSPYKITSVPRYVLLDKEGNIYDAFASRPSQNMQNQIAKVLEL